MFWIRKTHIGSNTESRGFYCEAYRKLNICLWKGTRKGISVQRWSILVRCWKEVCLLCWICLSLSARGRGQDSKTAGVRCRWGSRFLEEECPITVWTESRQQRLLLFSSQQMERSICTDHHVHGNSWYTQCQIVKWLSTDQQTNKSIRMILLSCAQCWKYQHRPTAAPNHSTCNHDEGEQGRKCVYTDKVSCCIN